MHGCEKLSGTVVEAVDKIPVENFMDKYLKGHFSAAMKKVKAVRESCKFADGFVRHLLFSRISGLTNLPFNGMAAPQKEESDGSSVPDSGTFNIVQEDTTIDDTDNLRSYIVTHINDSSCSEMVNIMQCLDNFDERVNTIGINGEWGGDIEIQLINRLFDLPITVINDQTNKIINMQPIHPDGIVLYLRGGGHYLWLKSNEDQETFREDQ